MRQLAPRDRGLGVPGDGFEDGVGEAVDGAAEEFVVGTVADAQVGGPGPFSLVFLAAAAAAAVLFVAGTGGGGIGGGEGGYGAGGAVGDEGRVGGDVGDDVV